MDSDTILGRDILQLHDEIAVGKVSHLPAPTAAHALENQVLEDDGVVFAAKRVGQFPLEVASSVADAGMKTVKLPALAFTVAGTLDAPREIAAPAAELAKAFLEEHGVVHRCAVAQRHVSPQPEVNAHGCTIVCLSEADRGLVENHDDEIFPKAVALDGECPHLPFVRTAQREFEPLANPVYRQDVVAQGIAALLEYDGGEVACLAELRGTLRQAGEETLVGGVKTLENLLHRLRVKHLPVDTVREVRLHSLAADVPAVQAVVPALKRKGMIPYKRSLSEHRVKMPRAPVAI